MPTVAVILPAAGASNRFGRNKLLEPLRGVPVIARAIAPFTDATLSLTLQGIYLATSAATKTELASIDLPPNTHIIEGGPTRAHSVLNALKAVPTDVDFVAIHDAARPLVSTALIERLYAHAVAHGSAIPALPVKLTIKQADGPLPARVQRTIPRHTLWEMQTPQVVRRADLLTAYARCPVPLDQITDDAQLLELAGLPVWLVAGDERNLKLTTPQDLALAEQLLSSE
jgi:2-C-methyl-D-erythritol 4-phosphate cytidylyltransferase